MLHHSLGVLALFLVAQLCLHVEVSEELPADAVARERAAFVSRCTDRLARAAEVLRINKARGGGGGGSGGGGLERLCRSDEAQVRIFSLLLYSIAVFFVSLRKPAFACLFFLFSVYLPVCLFTCSPERFCVHGRS